MIKPLYYNSVAVFYLWEIQKLSMFVLYQQYNTFRMIDELLSIWEETYKKGQLTFWLFLSLKHGEKYVDEIRQFIHEFSEGTISYDEQGLYRSLRKFQHLEIVDYSLKPGNSGPDRKYYQLSPNGRVLLEKFVKRNINLLQSHKISNLLNTNP